MAFLKYAKAAIVKPTIHHQGWQDRIASTGGVSLLSKEASKVTIEKYDPKDYLLTHCTIIASVDTETPASKLGKQMVDGFQIDRKYGDYYITLPSTKYVNNNQDAWERKLLLACFKTFVGGENYVEHIQIPELSKGKIIDAAARDIGDSIYVDILVATKKEHRPLISAITSGQLQTLSMGCQVQFTICSRCGNVAYDETQLCPHIKYFKGSEFIDELGQKRKIAELCGHLSEEPGSVKFIEASWVANPAFTGAVLRNILSEEDAARMSVYLASAIAQGPRTADTGAIQKAAAHLFPPDAETAKLITKENHQGALLIPREFAATELPAGDPRIEEMVVARAAEWNQDQIVATPRIAQGEQQQGEGFPARPEADAAPAAEDKDPLAKIVDDLAGALRERAMEKLRGEINKGEGEKVRDLLEPNPTNDSLIKSALKHAAWKEIARTVVAMTGGGETARKVFLGLVLHKAGGWKAVQTSGALTGREVLAVSRVLDLATRRASQAGEGRIYRTVMAVGGIGSFRNADSYLTACRQAMGRNLTDSEKAALLAKGRLFALGSS
jgi:hypothetical protein